MIRMKNVIVASSVFLLVSVYGEQSAGTSSNKQKGFTVENYSQNISTDEIKSISGPTKIKKGQMITVNIDYETEDKDLIFILQKEGAPWTNYVHRTKDGKEDGRTITFKVPNEIPDGTPLMYQAYLTPKGKGWSDKVSVKWQKGVVLTPDSGVIDVIDSISGPEVIQKGQTITVNIDYKTEDKELRFMLQQTKAPWTHYYDEEIPSSKDGNIITFKVPNNIPDGTPLMYQAYLAPKGKGWADKVAVKWQKPVTLRESQVFILGVNIGGTSGVTIDKHAWLSEDDAKKKGMKINSANRLFKTKTNVTPIPAVGTDTNTMLNSVRWAQKDWNIKYPMPNGTYSVSVWIMENYKSNFREIDVNVEAQTKQAIGALAKGHWKKYTYTNVNVEDGELDIALHGNNDVHIMGFEVLGTPNGDKPPTITLNGSATVNLKVGDTYTEAGATATDKEDGNISSKIIISGDTVDTSTKGNYKVKYTVTDSAGNEATVSRVVDVRAAVVEFPWDHGALEISKDKHMLQHADGTGFFWMADTAWHLPHKLKINDVTQYLDDRQSKGFNLIQMVAANNGVSTINAYGTPAFINHSYKTPNEDYWKHVDKIISEAEKRGMYIGLLPSWNTRITNISDANTYGHFIAGRYKDRKNILWINGGDSAPGSINHTTEEIWDALGKALDSEIKNSSQLITYHPGGGRSSSNWFNNASWLDFNMIQSGHCGTLDQANNLFKYSYSQSSNKPILDGEPLYETIEKCFYQDTRDHTRFTSNDARGLAYRQVFSGAFGHTYGHHSIWQISERADPHNPRGINATVNSWQDALNSEGAVQMKHLAKLMNSRPILGRVPDNAIIQSGNDAIATKGKGYAMAYLPVGGSVTVNLTKVANRVKAWWYDPETGVATDIGSYTSASQTFTTTNSDMVLVLDDATSKDFPAPGGYFQQVKE